jgi:hypothetical protein
MDSKGYPRTQAEQADFLGVGFVSCSLVHNKPFTPVTRPKENGFPTTCSVSPIRAVRLRGPHQ